MPNPHYQRVLEQDQALPMPLRWLSRAMSSWWTIGVLGVFVFAYVAAAHLPIRGRYIWQWPAFDTTQHAALTWWPLMVVAWLLAAVILWSAIRRLPWRIDNLGAFVAVLGLAIVLVSQSWAFRSQTVGIAAVPISPSSGNQQTDALSLNYTTRMGDTHERVLVLMAGGSAPITLPLEGLPRWNDATGDSMPQIKLHDDPKLVSVIGFGTRIVTTAYIADGTLTATEDGTQSAKPTPANERDNTSLPIAPNALLALEITTDLEGGGIKTTTAWIPFEPDDTDALVPKHFFPIEGLGSIGLAFRPASQKMPFALGGIQNHQKRETLYIADSDAQGKLLQPAKFNFDSGPTPSFNCKAIDADNTLRQYTIKRYEYINGSEENPRLLVQISTGNSNLFILAGMTVFVLGVILDRVLVFLAPRPSKNTPHKTE